MSLITRIYRKLAYAASSGDPFTTSSTYWEARYRDGGNSGAGSHGALAEFKADTLNSLVADYNWTSVIELGCGDGAQLSLSQYPSYVGVDVSPTAIARCRERFASAEHYRFIVTGEEELIPCDVGLSLDVIYHLVEDEVFEAYMSTLLSCARRAVVLYTSDSDVFEPPGRAPAHVRHRPVQRWITARYPEWRVTTRIANRYPFDRRAPASTSFADFYLYERHPPAAGDAT